MPSPRSHRLSLYLIDTLLPFFFTVFLSLFAIASVVFLIQIAAATSVIHISLAEFGILYLFVIPQLLFYTLPVSFFAGTVLGLAKLSFDMEMIVLFTLRATIRDILRPLVWAAAAVAALLLLTGLILAPLAQEASKHFYLSKQFSASLNLRPSELGQKFGDWLIFASASDPAKRQISDMILYLPDVAHDKLVMAARGHTAAENDRFHLKLENGKGYMIDRSDAGKETLQIIDFAAMRINKTATSKTLENGHPLVYWAKAATDKKRAKDLRAVLMTAAFPLLSLFFIPLIGIINPRHQKNHAYSAILAITLVYYVGVFVLSPSGIGSAVFLILWGAAGWQLCRMFPSRRY